MVPVLNTPVFLYLTDEQGHPQDLDMEPLLVHLWHDVSYQNYLHTVLLTRLNTNRTSGGELSKWESLVGIHRSESLTVPPV